MLIVKKILVVWNWRFQEWGWFPKILTLFNVKGVAKKHHWGPQNAIYWPIFIQIQILTLPKLRMKGFYTSLQFQLFLTIYVDSRAKCVFDQKFMAVNRVVVKVLKTFFAHLKNDYKYVWTHKWLIYCWKI